MVPTSSSITLAIPNWNGATYLRATLESLATQRDHVRWWFQDAKSSDESVAIAREFATEHDRIISEPDDGQPDALNRSISVMGGEIIGWLNSDDLLADGAAEAVLQAFRENPDVDVIYGEVDWIDADGNVTGHHSGQLDSLSDVLDIYRVWWHKRQWVQPEVFYRRSLWDKVGGINTNYDLAFDFELWTRFFLADAKVLRLPRVLTRFRLHDAQKSTRSFEAACEIRNIVQHALTNAEEPKYGLDHAWLQQLKTRLSYDRYQSGQDYPDPATRPTLLRALVSHPEWLRLPQVRDRIMKRDPEESE